MRINKSLIISIPNYEGWREGEADKADKETECDWDGVEGRDSQHSCSEAWSGKNLNLIQY